MDTDIITVSQLVCVTYQANNHVLPYHFVGKTEAEARKKLQEWRDNVVIRTDEDAPTDGRREFAGKVWMINHVLRQRARVNPSEVDAYLANGYVHGGPKTKFVED